MVSEVPVLLADGYLMDIKEIVEKDNEWSSIPKAVADSTHFGSGIYTVPSALFSYGFFVNDELFDAANVPRLDVGFEWSEMLAAVKALTNPAQQVLGLNEVTYFPDWIPHYLNDSLGHSTWDGEKFNLDSQEFITGIQWCNEILTGKYSYDALDEDEAAVYNAEWYGDVWAQGKLAVSYDATYSLPDYEAAQESFDSRFIGMPGNKNIVIPDFVGISSTCENPEAAFDFIKYMTFGKEGFLKRIELRDKEGYILESLPITNDQEVLDAYFANAFPGLEEAYATMDTTLIEGETVIPGYVAAMYEGLTGISVELNGEAISNATVRDVINACMYGNLNIADYVGQLNRLANEKVAAMQAEIDEYVK
jgi:multiple sugar transport system substrate-binding protein